MHEEFNACEWLVDRHVGSGRGDAIALRSGGQSVTYGDLLDRVEAVSTGLRRLGVRPEERVAMVMLDSVEFVATFLAAMRIGAVPVLANPLLPPRDLAVIVADSRARVLVASAERGDAIEPLLAEATEVEQVVVTPGDGVPIGIEWATFTSDASDGAPYPTWAESPGFWLCTSGTTGLPKLAMHRHGDLRATFATYANSVLGIGAADRCYSVGPMFHAYGLGNSLTFPLAAGATAILEPTRPPTPELVARIVQQERPTLFFCIPTFYAALTNAGLAAETFASVRAAVSAAEPLPAETFNRFRDEFGVTILDGIGSTEMLHIFLSNRLDATHPGTSGVAVDGYELRIVDDHGNDVADGEPGQLLVGGESAATGYWCRSDTSRSTFRGDWVYTGDLYVRSPEGWYSYLGRTDDMLRVGGEWVSPAEVEAVLIEHAGVLEAAVVGETDADSVTRPIAHVIAAVDPAPTSEELAEWCRERLAGYKRPRRFEMVAELPKTATGKIQRYRLRSETD